METRNDAAYFKATTEELSVPHPMWWRTGVTLTTARCCCGMYVILLMHIKLPTAWLTWLLTKFQAVTYVHLTFSLL